MAEPYVGEIRMFAGNFAPAGWMFCEGQPLPIAENETLYQLIGTQYGGDGVNNFALPDLRGRLPLHQGNGFLLAQSGGAEEVTLTATQIAAHPHPLLGSNNNASTTSPSSAVGATLSIFGVLAYGTDAPKTNLLSSAVGIAGSGEPHTNFQPFLCISFIISLFGIYPSPT